MSYTAMSLETRWLWKNQSKRKRQISTTAIISISDIDIHIQCTTLLVYTIRCGIAVYGLLTCKQIEKQNFLCEW